MKKFLHKSMAILMAVVVLFTTMSFTVDMHYCGDSLVDFSLFQSAETCGMEKEQSSIGCENPMLTKNSCCSDEQLIIEGQENLKQDFTKLTFEQQTFVAAFTYSYINLFEVTESEEVPFNDYPRPFVKRDVQVLHQTFLI